MHNQSNAVPMDQPVIVQVIFGQALRVAVAGVGSQLAEEADELAPLFAGVAGEQAVLDRVLADDRLAGPVRGPVV